jgi:hypothetical protein
MNKIKISGPETVTAAAHWCKENIGNSGWNLEFADWGVFNFTINDPETASIFALKWIK